MPETTATLNLGSVLSRTFDIWFKNIVPFGALALIVYSPFILYALIAPVTGSFTGWLYGVMTGLLPMALGVVVSGAVAYGVFRQMKGQPVPFTDAIRVGIARFLPALGTGLLLGLALLGGLLLFFFPAVIFACVFYVAVVVAVVERTRPIDSMRRSAALTKRSRWQVFTIALVLGLVGAAINWIISMPFKQPPRVAPTADVGEILAATYRGMRIPIALGLVVGSVVGCLSAVAAVVVYYDVRSQKEQVDLEKIAAVFA